MGEPVIDGPAAQGSRRPTQEERRTATRARVALAAADALAEHGHEALTTRAVAQRAGVSQPTVMHYFATRGALLTEAMALLCGRVVDAAEALGAALPSEDATGPGMLDHLWEQFKSPNGVAIGQVWCAAWADDDLTPVVADFDRRHVDALMGAMQRVHPADTDVTRLAALVELVLASFKGLLLLRPVTTPAELDARWRRVRPLLVRAAADVRDHTRQTPHHTDPQSTEDS